MLGRGSRFEGISRLDGDLRVEGVFEGALDVGGTLVIGDGGEFTGEIRARDVVVRGRLRGRIQATRSVELQRGCHFEGDLRTRTFVVEEGVYFQGNCRMEEAAGSATVQAATAESEPADGDGALDATARAAVSSGGEDRAEEAFVRPLVR